MWLAQPSLYLAVVADIEISIHPLYHATPIRWCLHSYDGKVETRLCQPTSSSNKSYRAAVKAVVVVVAAAAAATMKVVVAAVAAVLVVIVVVVAVHHLSTFDLSPPLPQG